MGFNQSIYNTVIGLLSNTSGKEMGADFFCCIFLILKTSKSKYGLQLKKRHLQKDGNRLLQKTSYLSGNEDKLVQLVICLNHLHQKLPLSGSFAFA